MTTTVVNVKSGEPFDTYIGRAVPRRGYKASPYANPYVLGRDGTPDEVVAKYDRWINESDDPRAVWIRAHAHELRGATFGCWCAPPGGVTANDPWVCHGQPLAKMADSETTGGNVSEQGLSAERLSAIRVGVESATPGPWFFNSYGAVFSAICPVSGVRAPECPQWDEHERTLGGCTPVVCWFPVQSGDTATPQAAKDARFIEDAREDIPALLTEVDRLTARVAELEAVVEAAREIKRALPARTAITKKWPGTVLTIYLHKDEALALIDALAELDKDGARDVATRAITGR